MAIENQITSLFKNVQIIRVVLDEKFEFNPFLNWFDITTQQKITSYYHYRDRLIAFTSNLLQKYYLASITRCESKELVINYARYHKPYIAAPHEIARKYNFNIAHCCNQVVMAVYNGDDYMVGIDIEKIDNKIEINQMAPIVFSNSERLLIENSSTNFFKLWTKKEALIKAIGTGFATDFYQDTALNLADFESGDNYHITCCQIEDYFLSICLYKS